MNSSVPPLERAQSRSLRLVTAAVLVSACACLAAAGATWVLVWRALHVQTAEPAQETALQVLWQLDAEWNSDQMLGVRAGAASALLERRGAAEIADVLQFFDQVAYLAQRLNLDRELLGYRFYRPATCYWKASEFLRSRGGASDRDRYPYLPALIEVLRSFSQRRFGVDGKSEPSTEEVRDFLLSEARGGSCGEDEPAEDSAQMTPL